MPVSQKPFRPADVLKQVMVQGLALSPDGESLVYSRRTIEHGKYRSRLWRVPYRGGHAEQLTFADASDGQPRFSPDGSTLMFISDRSEKPQVWTMPIGGGEPRMVAEMPEGAGAAEWSPDGKRLLLLGGSGEQRFIVGKHDDPVARRIREYVWRVDGVGVRDQNTSVWIAQASGRGAPVRVTRSAFDVSRAVWSPDGSRIGFLADPRPNLAAFEVTQAWWVPSSSAVTKGAPSNAKERTLATLDGGVWGLAWGPGGLAFAGIDRQDPHGWERQLLYVAERGGLRPLDDGMGDRTAAVVTYGDLVDPSSAFSATLEWLDARSIVALVSDRGRSRPYRFDLDGSAVPLVEGDVVCTALVTGGGHAAVVANVDSDAGEVYAVEDGELRRVTTNGSRWFGPFRRVPERLEIKHRDGHTVEGWLLRARGHRKAPLVVQVHGGPHAAHNPTPWLEMLALADAGFHVVWANPRGSTSYGEEFARAIDGAWGDADASDLLLMVDRIVRMGLTDRRRVGVLGLSYGGFMVHWLLGHFPGRFAAGVSENPVTDLVSEFGNSDFGTDIGKSATGRALPSDSFSDWLERSPYTKIHLSEAPLLLLQCENDLRCPPVNSEIPFAILKTLGREVEMVRYPDESHVMLIVGRPDRRVDRLERIVGWFQEHL
jgi:dipeptidyl aminopeptidase/acylaminoacyl peptidase